ncbi:hypothetical protein BDN72DRAFT_906563 [Pluteus cervinus]|uniref:Uncharacterized protein n=1 Tax=Pluteus cervinus TaxID=181527 RepID=A0ACD3A155_9AGAR|nr:hypothetical protein BDN72DRAFT_906563 [Pluteus cervinus]
MVGAYRKEDGTLQVYHLSASSASGGTPYSAPPEVYKALRDDFLEHMEKTIPVFHCDLLSDESTTSIKDTTAINSAKDTVTNNGSSSLTVDEDFDDLDNNEDYRGFKRLRRRSMTVESEDDADMGSPPPASSRLTSPSSSSVPDLVSITTTPTSSHTSSRASSRASSHSPSPTARMVSPVQTQHDEPIEDPSPCTVVKKKAVKKTYSRRGRKYTKQVTAVEPSAPAGDSISAPARSRGRRPAEAVVIPTVPVPPANEDLVNDDPPAERRSKRCQAPSYTNKAVTVRCGQ